MNILDYDSLNQILSCLNYKSLTSISLISKSYNNLIKTRNLLKIRKNYGFPRESWHCECHNIDCFDDDDYDNLNELLDIDFELEDIDNLYDDADEYLIIFCDYLLDKFYELDINLIRGDLLWEHIGSNVNKTIFIFTGSKIIPLQLYKNKRILPSEFTVIKNNVPVNYWKGEYYINNNDLKRYGVKGISNNSFVWLGVDESIKDQCIQNIKNDGMIKFSNYSPFSLNSDLQYTEFIINNKTYYIIITYLTTIELFINMINKTKILLTYKDYTDIFCTDISSSRNILIFNKYDIH